MYRSVIDFQAAVNRFLVRSAGADERHLFDDSGRRGDRAGLTEALHPIAAGSSTGRCASIDCQRAQGARRSIPLAVQVRF